MDGKYLLLALVVTCGLEPSHAHILPFNHGEFPMQECVKTLTRSVIILCSTYGDYVADWYFDHTIPLLPREVIHERWTTRERVIKTCCTKPCTIPELLATC